MCGSPYKVFPHSSLGDRPANACAGRQRRGARETLSIANANAEFHYHRADARIYRR